MSTKASIPKVRSLSALAKQKSNGPAKRQNQPTLQEFIGARASWPLTTPSTTPPRSRHVFIEDSDDDNDDNESSSVQNGTKEMPIFLDDDTESSNGSSDEASGAHYNTGSRKRRKLSSRSEVTNEVTYGGTVGSGSPFRRATQMSERKVGATVARASNRGDFFPVVEVVKNAPVEHQAAEADVVVLNLAVDENDEPHDPVIEGCIRDVEEYEASKLTVTGPYNLKQFKIMWKQVEVNLGLTTEAIESGKLIRGANRKMDSEETDVQSKAQYGRLLPSATNKLLTTILELTEDDIFLDFGHGIGNACLQAAYTIGCEARGIEVVSDRHFVAQQFSGDLARLNEICLTKDSIKHKIGTVDLRQGRLEATVHRSFLTEGVTAAFVNNFNGVFRERSSEKTCQLRYLDDYLAGLLAMMSTGTRFVSLHPLPLCLSKSDANKQRGRFGWAESDDASFFELEEVELDEARKAVSWSKGGGNKKMIKLFKYIRTRQSVDHSVFLCCNPKCEKAQNAVPIKAIVENSDGRVVLNRCDCGFEPCNLRARGAKKQDYTEV